MAVSGLKRSHEDAFVDSCPMSDYHQLRKDSQHGTRNVASLSTDTINNYHSGDDRVHSPNAIMDAHNMFVPSRESKRALSFASKREEYDSENDPDAEKRVTIWNWREQRKLSGNSAPFKKNLKDYIRKHPDWEEYVGQDKDAITGKKLSPKKMKPPAPQDPEHPWYTMQRSGALPTTPSAATQPAPATPHTSSYGTRSTQSRLHDDNVRHTPKAAPPLPVEPQAVSKPVYVNPELSQPMNIILEPPSAVAYRRSVEMAARRQAMATQVDAKTEDKQSTTQELEAEAAAEAAAWKAASEKVAQLRAEKEAAEQKISAEAHAERQKVHAEAQHTVVNAAMARIEAFKNKRRVICVPAH